MILTKTAPTAANGPGPKSHLNGLNFIEPRRSSSIEKTSEILDELLLYLENRRLEIGGSVLNTILHRAAAAILLCEGWTPADLLKLEAAIIDDLAMSPGAAVIRDVPARLSSRLRRATGSDVLIVHNRIVRIPGPLLNACISEALQRSFSLTELAAVGIFRSDGAGGLRIDIDARLARVGFFMPVRVGPFLTSLMVFRHPDDRRPFRLAARGA